MAYCIDSYEIIICPECHAKVLYDDRDVKVFIKTPYDTFHRKVLECPNVMK